MKLLNRKLSRENSTKLKNITKLLLTVFLLLLNNTVVLHAFLDKLFIMAVNYDSCSVLYSQSKIEFLNSLQILANQRFISPIIMTIPVTAVTGKKKLLPQPLEAKKSNNFFFIL